MIDITDFNKIELKIGTILEAFEVKDSEKLIKLKVDIGEENPRQILSGIKQWYNPMDLVGQQVVVVANLTPRMIMGLESQGMILAASDDENGPICLSINKPIKNGSKVS